MSLVFPGTGTGALRSRRIHVSISLISQAINDDICSVDMLPLEPVRMPQTVSRVDDEEAPEAAPASDEEDGDVAGEDLEEANDRS